MNRIDQKKVDKFWKKRAKIQDPLLATHFKKDKTHEYDLKLILQHCNPESSVLDVACGTCFLTNQLTNEVGMIKGIDKHPEFLEHCRTNSKFSVEIADILDYEDDNKYDLILMFGIVMYFNETDTQKIYSKYARFLKPNGKLIVKHQSGVDQDVYIDKYSEQIGQDYHALYKSRDKDLSLLREVFSNVEVVDIYPVHLNPWPDTHFYAFIASNS